MITNLNIVLECYAFFPILESPNTFNWLNTETTLEITPKLVIRHNIEFLIINMKKIKLEDCIEYDELKHYQLHFPFTHNNFITFVESIILKLIKKNSWLYNLQYKKDYILAPLLVSFKEVFIGIIILSNSFMFKSYNILESNTYLSKIQSNQTLNNNFNNYINNKECKCDILSGLLEMTNNKLSERIKCYIMNCRGYIPSIQIHRIPKQINIIRFSSSHLK